MAVIPSQTYIRFRIWSRLTLLKVQSYSPTKCRPNTSIHGCDIITYSNQTVAVLKFYTRFPYWPFPGRRHVILH